jgi:uncharacterized protein YbjQ (UPF0145 family)
VTSGRDVHIAPEIGALLIALDTGFAPVTTVLGATTYQLNPQAWYCRAWSTGGHRVLENYEDALDAMWTAAVDRLEDEARAVGAHGVIGVSLREETVGVGVHQLQLSGTAVVVPGAPVLAEPFLSYLAADDVLRLLRGGWAPTAIGWGVAAVHVHSWSNNAWWQGTTFTNAEMQVPTEAMQEARARCQHHLHRTLGSAGGVLVSSDLTVVRTPQKCGNQEGGTLIRGRLTGTAVVRFGAPAAPTLPVVRLTGRTR